MTHNKFGRQTLSGRRVEWTPADALANRPKRTLRAILASTSTLALMASPALGADACAMVGSSCTVSKSGAAATPAQGAPSWPGNGQGNPGGAGGNSDGIDLILQQPAVYRSEGQNSALNIVSQGADGEQGSNATQGGFNKPGGDGGRGGDSGNVSVSVGPDIGGLSTSSVSAATIASVGGEGGAGGAGNQNSSSSAPPK